jgi:hypothetical protein
MWECVSIKPGVTYLPPASITTAPAGASTLCPTEAILPSRISTAPPRITGPAAVRIVAFRMSIAGAGTGWYVLGNGSALGSDTAPRPTPPGDVVAGAAAPCPAGCVACIRAQAAPATASSNPQTRITACPRFAVVEGRSLNGRT